MEPIRQADVVTLDHVSRVAEARRTARRASERLGLPEEAMGRAELVAVELANNIVQHATGAPQGVTAHVREERRPRAAGKLFVSSDPAGADRPARVQIVAVDQGPGMASVERCLQDGFTTRSTPGLGLGAVYRLSEQADVFSELGSGTVVSALVGSRSEGGYFGEAGQGTAVLSTAL